MMRENVKGYIVVNRSGPMELTVYDGKYSVLCEGRHASLFSTSRGAKAAMRRSLKYAGANQLLGYWDTEYRVILVIA